MGFATRIRADFVLYTRWQNKEEKQTRQAGEDRPAALQLRTNLSGSAKLAGIAMVKYLH